MKHHGNPKGKTLNPLKLSHPDHRPPDQPRFRDKDIIRALNKVKVSEPVGERRVIGEFRGDHEVGFKLSKQGDKYELYVWESRGNYDGGDRTFMDVTRDQVVSEFKEFFRA